MHLAFYYKKSKPISFLFSLKISYAPSSPTFPLSTSKGGIVETKQPQLLPSTILTQPNQPYINLDTKTLMRGTQVKKEIDLRNLTISS
jgi:hypothetical protein